MSNEWKVPQKYQPMVFAIVLLGLLGLVTLGVKYDARMAGRRNTASSPRMQEDLSRVREQKIVYDLTLCQDRIREKVDAIYPVDVKHFQEGNIEKNADMHNELLPTCTQYVLQKYGINDAELRRMRVRGFKEKWPLPPLK